MTLEEILSLIKAGYTKEEINALAAPAPATPAADPEKPATPAAPAAPTPPIVPDYGALIAQLTAQVSGLTKAVQIANLHGANQPPEHTDSAEDILAKLINPTYKADNK